MKLRFLCLLAFLLVVSRPTWAQNITKYDVNITNNLDTFYVKVNVPKTLSKTNNVFQFAATAPGTYQTMNIGRFVSNFKAFSKSGKEIKTSFVAPNQYVFKKPKKVSYVTYNIAETFDTKVKQLPIYLMAGTTIEADHSLLNTHGICGYFKGFQTDPVEVKINPKENWEIGTAMKKNAQGAFVASSFDEMVDSPILTGNMTKATTTIGKTPIEVLVYSETGKIKADMILKEMDKMLHSAEKYLVELPVDHYSFLFYFPAKTVGVTGAWEHSYSSEYVMAEAEPTEKYLKQIVEIASHEFFHIVTPLNIHSEIIEHFNFEKPTPSEHLWLYEGVTEWAAHMQLYRGGVISLEQYIDKGLKEKIMISSSYFKQDWSLKKIAEESFNGGEGANQYSNVYFKGSLVATYLDILLLEKSDGKFGLREVMLDLVKQYGKGKPFSEKTFFDDLAKMTYPEVKDFTEKYIRGTEKFSNNEFLNKIGLKIEKQDRGFDIIKVENPTEQQQKLFNAWSVNLPR